MHITSLPSPYGIGTMGVEAYRFADFLKQTGQHYWQILPINPTGFADSPYQSFSTYAGNPYLIDLDMLYRQDLLCKEEYADLDWGSDPCVVDYGKVYENKFNVLKKAVARAKDLDLPGYTVFYEQNRWWLDDYAVFMAAKQAHGMREWTLWQEDGLRQYEADAVAKFAAEHEAERSFWQYVQYLFYQQWNQLKKYVNDLGIQIVGDIPIYVSGDSADVWAQRENFHFDDKSEQIWYAGVPPDYFSEDGQFWGNPVYRWDYMHETGYKWWVDRLRFLKDVYDVIRIDHFRGFEAYYVIERGEKTARNGQWVKGPALEFFDVIHNKLGELPLIAEDLGFLTEEVHKLRRMTGYPGMKILQFAFDEKESSDYLPHKYEYNCVVYTGTHDNNTLLGWMDEVGGTDVQHATEYCALTEKEGYVWGMIRMMYASVANLCIAQMQDFLELPGSARMNMPSTVGGNWCWRAEKEYAKPTLINKIKRMVKLYGRYYA